MYLKQVELFGFKSFANKTIIEFEKGNLSAIVGPNGSGKSNIIDAIRWVFGEQSSKNLRGSSMTDVIFAGSDNKKQMNFAQVTLVIDNEDNELNINFQEVSITRKLYRSGESEYILNNQKCRLKDIKNLLLDTGIGKDSLSIISQGQIENFINSKPIDRRYIFEEAAGVLTYKENKKESLSKLEKTNKNLARVSDIINEITDNRDNLKDQADNARKYIELNDSLKNLELKFINEKIIKIHEEQFESKNILNQRFDEQLKTNKIMQETDQKIAKSKIELNNLTNSLSDKQDEIIIVKQDIEKTNGEITLAKYKIDSNEVDSQKRIKNTEMLNLELNKISSEFSSIDYEISIKTQEMESLTIENKSLKEKLLKIKENHNNYNSINNTISGKIQSLEHKRNILIDLERNFSNFFYGVKSILQAKKDSRVSGVSDAVANIINIEDKYQYAIEMLLGSTLQFVVVDNENDASNAIKYLKNNEQGRATFIPMNKLNIKSFDEQVLSELRNSNGFIDVASKLVKIESRYSNLVENLLGNVALFDNIDNAKEYIKRTNKSIRIVTIDGEVITPNGFFTGGKTKNSKKGLLTQKQEIQNCETEISKLKNELKELDENNENYEVVISKLESDIYANDISLIKMEAIIENIVERRKMISLNSERINAELSSIDTSEEVNVDIDELQKRLDNNLLIDQEINNQIKEIRRTIFNLNTELEEDEVNAKELSKGYSRLENELNDIKNNIEKMSWSKDNFIKRLEEDYELTYDDIKEYRFTNGENLDEISSEIRNIKSKISSLGAINLLAIEEFDELETRFEFLNSNHDELVKSRDEILSIIDNMDKEMKESFISIFKRIQENFTLIFKEVLGGEAKIYLEDESDILNSGIDIIAKPRGKNAKSISLLSGGEKTLTTICLLLAILKVKKIPFCLFDEVESALDEANVLRIASIFKKITKETQIITITHRRGTMENADVIYGASMQEPGITSILSVSLKEADEYID